MSETYPRFVRSNDLINDEEARSLMVAINRRYGLDFTKYELKSLKRGLTRLMVKYKMKTILDLWAVVLMDESFLMSSIDELMVNLTELFRNPDAWIKIRDNVMNQYKGQSTIDIWHAGCSTGEEVYSMAILLDEVDMLSKSSAYASDLSSKVLEKAEKGVYSRMIMNNYDKAFINFNPDRQLNDFFDFQEDQATIKNKYKTYAKFMRHNLVHDPIDKKFDIIFCRNVMIYFDKKLKHQVLSMFNEQLNDNGFLVMGYYDTLPDSCKDIFDIYDNKTRIYRKKSLKSK
jgi:chemotaxis protein methyltransferase CheR